MLTEGNLGFSKFSHAVIGRKLDDIAELLSIFRE